MTPAELREQCLRLGHDFAPPNEVGGWAVRVTCNFCDTVWKGQPE